MALKRKVKINPNFSMASMTDIIFLLLIFFMVTSTVVVPNSLKITLPQAAKQTAVKSTSRIYIDKELKYHVAFARQNLKEVAFEELTPFLDECKAQEPDMPIALHADESVPLSEVVKVLDLTSKKKFNMVLMTRPPNRNNRQ